MKTVSLTEDRRHGWYYGWTIVTLCVLAGAAASTLSINAFSLFVRPWSSDLHTPISTLTFGIAACGLVCSVLSPIVGGLADRYPSRILYGVGLILTALFCFGIAAVRAPWQFILLYALLLPPSLVLSTAVPANALVSRWFVHRRGLALGLTGFGLALGGIIAPPLLAYAIPAIGWRMIWQALGAVTLVLILPVMMLGLREQPEARDGRRYLSTAVQPEGSGVALRWREIFGRRAFWVLIAVYIPMLALYGAFGQNAVPLAMSRGIDAATASLFVSLYSAGQIIATLGGGALADRIGNRIPLSTLAFLTALGGVLAASGHGPISLGVAAVLVGAGGGFWPLLANAAVREFGAVSIGRAFGALSLFIPLTSVGAISVSVGPERLGSYAPPLITLAVIVGCGGLICLTLLRDQNVEAAGG